MNTSFAIWVRRASCAALTTTLTLWSASVGADTIHARTSSTGLILQLTPLVSGGAATKDEVGRNYFMEGSINSSLLGTHGFTQSTPGNSFPIEHEIAIEDGTLKAVATDPDFRGTVEVLLSPSALHRDRQWDAAQKLDTQVALWLSPATTLTATTYVDGMLWLDGPANNVYQASASWTLKSYSNAGFQTASFSISNSSGQFPVSDDEYLQLVISNTTAAPMFVVLESAGMATAIWTPASVVPIPEPETWLMFALGLLVIVYRTRSIIHAARREQRHTGTRCRAGLGFAGLAAAALLLPTRAAAQAIDISATIGPVAQLQSGAGAPLVFTWEKMEILAQVRETGYPHVGRGREAIGTIPSPFEIERNSGSSWVDFGVAGPNGAATLQGHLEQHHTNPTPGSYMVAEIRGWIANIVVPAHTMGRIAMVVEITPVLLAGVTYQVRGNLGSPIGSSFWSSSAPGPNTGTIFSVPTFDNRTGSEPLHTGPVYFGGTITVEMPMTPIPEPSRAWMMAIRLILLLSRGNDNRRKLVGLPGVEPGTNGL